MGKKGIAEEVAGKEEVIASASSPSALASQGGDKTKVADATVLATEEEEKEEKEKDKVAAHDNGDNSDPTASATWDVATAAAGSIAQPGKRPTTVGDGRKPKTARKDKAKEQSTSASTSAEKKPPFLSMVKEAIIANTNTPHDARNGCSRQLIKKYIMETYGETDSAKVARLVSKALARGLEGGELLMPRGASGKVKLSKESRKRESPTASSSKPTNSVKTKTAAKRSRAELAARDELPTRPRKRAKLATSKAPTAKGSRGKATPAASKKATKAKTRKRTNRVMPIGISRVQRAGRRP